MSESDPFLEQVLKAKADAEARTAQEVAAHERALKDRFADDVALRDRLSKFAREVGLDKALIEVWEEVKSYSATTDPERIKFGATDISNDKRGDLDVIRLTIDGTPFEIRSKTADVDDEVDRHVRLTLFESGQEEFAVDTSEQYGQHFYTYRPFAIAAFRRQGRWATELMRLQGVLESDLKRLHTSMDFHAADEIKAKFSE